MSRISRYHVCSVILVIFLLGLVLILGTPPAHTQRDGEPSFSDYVFLPLVAYQSYAPAASALHVLPPLGQDSVNEQMFDRGLSNFLEIEVCQVVPGDGQMELLGRGWGGIVVHKFDEATNTWPILTINEPAWGDSEHWAFPSYYSTIQTADVDGDGQDELLGRGWGGIVVYKYDAAANTWKLLTINDPAWGEPEGWGQPEYYSTIQTADVDGDGQDELLGRGWGGIVVYKYDKATTSWKLLTINDPAWSDPGGWADPKYYSTIQTADVDGDGQDELLARGSGGIGVHKYDAATNTWPILSNVDPAWSDAAGWADPKYYSTIQTADVDGDGQDELLARWKQGMNTYHFDTIDNYWEKLGIGDPPFSDAVGWGSWHHYYSTIQTADVDGDGRDELLARGGLGMETYSFDSTDNSWKLMAHADPPLSDAAGWADPKYYSTIQTADVDGDGQDELLVRGDEGLVVHKYDAATSTWPLLTSGDPAWSNEAGWDFPKYYSTIQTMDATGCIPVVAIKASDITIENDHYHTEWKVAKSDTGKMMQVHFLVAGHELGYIEHTPDKAIRLPVDFSIDKHPQIWAWFLYAKGNSANKATSALKKEFDSSPVVLAQLLAGAGYEADEIGKALRDVIDQDDKETAWALKHAGFSAVEVAGTLEELFGVDTARTFTLVMKRAGISADYTVQGLIEAFSLNGKDVAELLKNALNLDAADATAILKGAKFLIGDIGQVLKEVYGLDASSSAQLLMESGSTAVEIADVMKLVYGMDAKATAQLLKSLGYSGKGQIGLVLNLVFGFGSDPFLGSVAAALILKDIGFSPSQILDVLMIDFVLTLDEARQVLEAIGFTTNELIDATAPLYAENFAPQLRFDSSAYNFPMSAQDYYEQIIDSGYMLDPPEDEKPCEPGYGDLTKYPKAHLENRDSSTLATGDIPTYFKVYVAGKQIRIVYWWFYGWQKECMRAEDVLCSIDEFKKSNHQGDWERVMVTLSEDGTRIASVTFAQHGGWYTRLAARNSFEIYNQTHPVVYVGKGQHGSYHDQGGIGGCGYWNDWRNNRGRTDLWMNSWNNLVSLSEPYAESWMEWDARQEGLWGYDGVSTHPTVKDDWGPHMMTCKGDPKNWMAFLSPVAYSIYDQFNTSGCKHSDCELGDRDDGIASCWHCQSGYIDIGFLCLKDCGWGPFCHSYFIKTYGFEYALSTTDAGLMYKCPWR